MKKIVFFIPFYGYPVPSVMGGGIEELMTILLNEHEKQDKPDCKFYFIHKALYGKTKKQFDKDFTFKNTEIIKIKYNRVFNTLTRIFNRFLNLFKIKKRFSNDYCKKSYKAIEKIEPDLIIFEGSYDIIAGQFAKKYGKDKVWFHAHMQETQKKENLNDYFGTIISVSNFISNDYKDFLKDNKNMNYKVLQNCVDEERFNKTITTDERNQIRQNFGFKNDDFISIYCGRICENKGADKLIEAVLSLDENFKVLIVGGVHSAKKQTTPYLQKIANFAKNNPSKIKYTGYIKNTDMFKIYQSADAQVVPTLCEEAAGLVVVEGQYSGLPQIVTNSGGMPEYINPEGAVVLEKDKNLIKNIASELKKLQNDKKNYKNMSENNTKFAQQYTKSNYYNTFMKIIKEN